MAVLAGELASGRLMDREKLRRLATFFSAHANSASTAGWGNQDHPSPSWISWLMHGGEAGRAWVSEHVGKVDMTAGNVSRRPGDREGMVSLAAAQKRDQLARDRAASPRPDTERDYELLKGKLEVKPRPRPGEMYAWRTGW